MNAKRIILAIVLLMTALPAMPQDGGKTLPPNYRRIAKEVKRAGGPYFLDSLDARFNRCDTTMTVDDIRCLYFGGGEVSLVGCNMHYVRLVERFGRHQGKANDAWWQLQMLLSAVWSTGDGTRRHPLHVRNIDDASFIVAHDYERPTKARRHYKRWRHLLIKNTFDDGTDVWFYVRLNG